jgi:Ca2+-binding EF-hand superfamily protein
MKRFPIFAVCLFALLFSASAFAQNPQGERNGRPRGGRKLKKMDANNDGSITRDEWKGDSEMFGRLDANNDGALTKEEIRARRRKRG